MVLKRASSDWEDGDGSEAPRHESKRRLAFATWVVFVISSFPVSISCFFFFFFKAVLVGF